MPFWRLFFAFFAARKNFRFFLIFGVSGLDGALQEVAGRETLQNKGFRSNFAFWYLVNLRWTRCIASMLHKFIENNFGGLTNLFFFGSSNFWPNWVWKPKNGLGLQSWGRFENDVFPIFPGRGPICEIFGARVCRVLGSSRARCHKWPCGCGAEGFSEFFGVLLSTPFLRIWKGISWNSPLFFSCFALFCVFFLGLGSTQPCTCVLGQLPLNPFLSFYKNTIFFPWKTLFLFISLCLPFFLLGFIHFSFHSLSLYFSCFLFFFPSLFCFFLWPSLFFAVLSCLVSLLLFQWKQQHQNIIDVKGFFSSIISVSFGFPVLLCLSNPFFLSLFFII